MVLSLESLSPLQARVRDEAAVAVVEPRGVIRLTYSSYSGVEGDVVRAESVVVLYCGITFNRLLLKA